MWRVKIRTVLTSLAVYISVTGLVTFSLFICEESIQTAMFGTWPAQDAGDWYTVKFGVERMKEANHLLKTSLSLRLDSATGLRLLPCLWQVNRRVHRWM